MSDIKRIAFIGKGGVGKTTLAKHYSEKLGIPLISESIRTSLNLLGLTDVNDLDNVTRVILQTHALSLQTTSESTCFNEGFVSDRARVDYLSYFKAMFGDNNAYKRLAMLINSQMRSGIYTDIIYVPPFSNTVENDGVRFDEKHMAVEDFVMNDLYEQATLMGAKFLSSVTIEDRIKEIDEYLGFTVAEVGDGTEKTTED